MVKKLILFCLILLLCITLVNALSTSNFGNINVTGNSTFRGSYLNITNGIIYGDGSGLINLDNQSVNYSQYTNVTNLNINTSVFTVSSNIFNIVLSYFTNLFYQKAEVYNTTEVDAQQLAQNNTIDVVNSSLQTEITLQANNNISQNTKIGVVNASLQTEITLQSNNNITQATAISDVNTRVTSVNSSLQTEITLQANNNVSQNTKIDAVNSSLQTEITLQSNNNITQANELSALRSSNTSTNIRVDTLNSTKANLANPTFTGTIIADNANFTGIVWINNMNSTNITGYSAATEFIEDGVSLINKYLTIISGNAINSSLQTEITLQANNNVSQNTKIDVVNSSLQTEITLQANNNVSNTALANMKALPGTASCAGVTVVQNITTTTTGTTSQCLATPQGTVTSVATTNPILGGIITSTGTITFNDTYADSKWNNTAAINSVDERVTTVNSSLQTEITLQSNNNVTQATAISNVDTRVNAVNSSLQSEITLQANNNISQNTVISNVDTRVTNLNISTLNDNTTQNTKIDAVNSSLQTEITLQANNNVTQATAIELKSDKANPTFTGTAIFDNANFTGIVWINNMNSTNITGYSAANSFIENGVSLINKYLNITNAVSYYVNRSLWTTIDNYPTACSGGTPNVQGIGDTLTCRADTDTTYSAGSGLTLTTTTFALNDTYADSKWNDTTIVNNVDARVTALNTSTLNDNITQATAIGLKSNTASPTFTGTVTIPSLSGSTAVFSGQVNTSSIDTGHGAQEVYGLNISVLEVQSNNVGVVKAWWDSFYCQLIGCTITGDLRVDNISGSAVLFVNSTSGNVGIETLSPATKLDVNGTLTTTNITFAHGGKNYDNASCTIILSPAGTGRLEVCD